MIVIKNAKVLTMERETETYEEVVVAVENGKISYVGPDKEFKGYEVIDAGGAYLLPGFIDAHTHLGMWENGIGFEGADGNESSDPVTPHMRGIDAINPFDESFDNALSGGVTTVASGPGSANCMGGTFAVIKTYGHRVDDMIVKNPLAMKIAFGENPKRFYGKDGKCPITRMGVSAEIRNIIEEAREYAEKREKGEEKYNKKLEALIPVIKREIPLKAHAHRADDVFSAIRIAKEQNLRLTLEHVTEGHLIAEDLAKEGFPCVIGPSHGFKTKFELQEKTFRTAGVLQKAGVKVCLMTDHPVIPIENLNMCAQFCVKSGMDRYEALKAITINPAEILELGDRLGSITVGKDADLVLWDNDPIDINSSVTLTIINGEVVYKKK